MVIALKKVDCAKAPWSRAVFACVALGALAAWPVVAQAQSMLGAPGLSPLAPDAQSTAVAAPPALSAAPQAGASSCDSDMAKFQEKRNAAVGQINAIMKGGQGKKLDPIAACPRFRNLVSVETQMKNWMIKNKEWCSIPDQVIEDMKKGFSRTPQIAGQACNAAAQVGRMRQQQQQQARSGGPTAAPAVKLPSGPL